MIHELHGVEVVRCSRLNFASVIRRRADAPRAAKSKTTREIDHGVTYCVLRVKHKVASLISPSLFAMSLLMNAMSRTLLRPLIKVAEQPSYFLLTNLRYKNSLKTISGVKKRFRLRGSGSIKRYVSYCIVLPMSEITPKRDHRLTPIALR